MVNRRWSPGSVPGSEPVHDSPCEVAEGIVACPHDHDPVAIACLGHQRIADRGAVREMLGNGATLANGVGQRVGTPALVYRATEIGRVGQVEAVAGPEPAGKALGPL